MPTTCLVYDERQQVRRRLELLLRSASDADAVVAALDVDDLLARVRGEPGEVVVVGTPRDGTGATDVVRRVLAGHPSAAVLVAGPSDESGTAGAALALGAVGFLRWDAPRTMIRTIIRTVGGSAAGEDLLPTFRIGTGDAPAAGGDVPLRGISVDLDVQRRLDLSVREVQVLVGVSRGLTNADIGRRLYLSDHTIKSHVQRLFRKLGVTDRAQAVGHAYRSGLFASTLVG